MADSFNEGDVVELKSGGPAMTVLATPKSGDKYYTCVWFKGASREQGRFPASSMKKYVAPKK